MKSQKIILFIAAIALVSLAFIPKKSIESSEKKILRDQWGTITSIDNINGCMTLDLCNGGTFSFGIIAGGGGGFYPPVGTGIIASLSVNSSACNNLFLDSWIVSECH